ncbi:MAG: pyridoxamine 5'-phosphate oxidase family protein [Alphaproteobacteria bacterium]|nr:pyridoxamine 5'-phosphate oxidase family protein [Alphaproteobacteria bacterium]
MSDYYSDAQRKLQDDFGTRPLADRVVELIVHDELAPEDQGFIESRDMFFLATVNADGSPTVSYKGGTAGFVRAVDSKTLAFPAYDGNGMFLSMGNISQTGEIGMLFIDFETPHRMRVQAKAEVSKDDPLMSEFPGAKMIVRATIKQIFINCPRYIHKHKKLETSVYAPTADHTPPMPSWKRIDLVQDVIPEADKPRVAAAGGPITFEEYSAKVQAGEG